jgi:imidazole glycerol phosphate synthase subunit HisF
MSYNTRPDSWTVANLRSFAEEKRIKIPSFQRRLRWSDDKKRGLLNSIDQDGTGNGFDYKILNFIYQLLNILKLIYSSSYIPY